MEAPNGARPQIAKLLENNLVWDNHGCMPLNPVDDSFLPQLERYRRSGVDVVSLNVGFDAIPWQTTLAVLAHFRRWIKRHPDKYGLVHSVADVELARSSGRLGVLFDIEGGCAFNDNPDTVGMFYDLGVRWALIAYNRNNSLGGGCQDDDCGLTPLGRRVIDEMVAAGMVTCCSHCGFRTAMDIIEYCPNPIIFSHSNPLGVWNHKRNICDEAIRACAETGGVIGINGIGMFLGDNDSRTETIVRHIDYVAQLVGAEHVGLALDYVFDKQELNAYIENNPDAFPPGEGYRTDGKSVEPEQIPGIVGGLLELGYSASDIAAILGGNHLRIARTVWK